METTKSLKMKRQRKLLLILPLLALPFLTLMFWALGGGQSAIAENKPLEKGFNHNLPDANLKEGNALDKMNYYDKAALDSARRMDLEQKDPNYNSPSTAAVATTASDSIANSEATKGNAMSMGNFRNPNEQKVYRRLAALQRVINAPASVVGSQAKSRTTSDLDSRSEATADIDRLEHMMQSLQQSDTQDPEMQQISGLLENILDIQHPERAQEKLRKASMQQRGQVFSVSASIPDDYLSSLNPTKPQIPLLSDLKKNNGFYSLEENPQEDLNQNAISAIVHETQAVVNGATVKLRLAGDIFINGVKIEKDNFIYGTASLKGERLAIKIDGLRYGNSLFPVDLSVYDLDGIEGIYIPGAISRDVAKASADRSAQSLGVTTLDDSWGAQAAGAGIEAAKTLFSKKVKLIKVVVKAGYQVLLRDGKQKQTNPN